MNFLKKKLKPLTSGLSSNQTSSTTKKQTRKEEEDLESDLYDDYVVEAPPHPSELLALGVDPTDIDVNDPEKLRDLYRKVKEEGKEKKINSVLLAKQREKEQIEEKKKTREEWKFFDSLTARCEEAVKSSQKKLDELKESSAIESLSQPEYEFRDHSEPTTTTTIESKVAVVVEEEKKGLVEEDILKLDEQDPFGFSISTTTNTKSLGSITQTAPIESHSTSDSEQQQQHIVEELFEDLGIDLRPSDQRAKSPITPSHLNSKEAKKTTKTTTTTTPINQLEEEDPFDTSFIESVLEKPDKIEETIESRLEAKFSNVDPFDTSFVNL